MNPAWVPARHDDFAGARHASPRRDEAWEGGRKEAAAVSMFLWVPVHRLPRRGRAIACGLGAAARLGAQVTHVKRLGRVWRLVAEQAAVRGGQVSAADVCAAVVPGVQVTGAWLSAAPDAQAGHLMQVTDEVSKQLAGLQLTLGEGPLLDASASGGPVLASALACCAGLALRVARRGRRPPSPPRPAAAPGLLSQ